MTSAKLWTTSSLVAIALLVGLLAYKPRSARENASAGKPRSPLLMYCAAGIKPPVEEIALAYETNRGVAIQLQYGGSGTLLSNLKVAQRGDLFLAADESYLAAARSNGIVREIIPLAVMQPVIGVRKGNPKNIRTLADLATNEVCLANADAAAIGKTTRLILAASPHGAAITRHVRVYKPTVNDVANDIKLGTVDAGILWDTTVRQYPELEMVPLENARDHEQRVSVGVLSWSAQPTEALRFARWLGAPDRGLKSFASRQYTTVPGDAWAETPEVVLYSGGVNRNAIEETVTEFEAREGARVTRVYNGCGILVAQIKAGQRPDAYFACDVSFMREVTEFFPTSTELSETRMVLIVPKGNPRAINSLADLARPGLKIGVANATQSALGALTARLLERKRLLDPVMANVRVQTPTADLLVNQMRGGSLDAAVVYQANTAKVGEFLTVVPLPDEDAIAVQPFGVLTRSKHALLMERLRERLSSRESRERFETNGFKWRLPQP